MTDDPAQHVEPVRHPSIRYLSPHLPLDHRFAKKYLLGPDHAGAVRIVVEEDRTATFWDSDDWQNWTLVSDAQVEVVWGSDGSLELFIDGDIS